MCAKSATWVTQSLSRSPGVHSCISSAVVASGRWVTSTWAHYFGPLSLLRRCQSDVELANSFDVRLTQASAYENVVSMGAD